jgi:hypothetical protein
MLGLNYYTMAPEEESDKKSFESVKKEHMSILAAILAFLAGTLLTYLFLRRSPKPPEGAREVDEKLRALEKREGEVPGDVLREEAAMTIGPMVESAARSIESFCGWLEGVGEVSGLEALAQLKKQVEGPLASLERYFKGVERYEGIMSGVSIWIAKLEVKGGERMSEEEVRALVEDARRWALECRNLHYEWARMRWPPG